MPGLGVRWRDPSGRTRISCRHQMGRGNLGAASWDIHRTRPNRPAAIGGLAGSCRGHRHRHGPGSGIPALEHHRFKRHRRRLRNQQRARVLVDRAIRFRVDVGTLCRWVHLRRIGHLAGHSENHRCGIATPVGIICRLHPTNLAGLRRGESYKDALIRVYLRRKLLPLNTGCRDSPPR